MENNKGIKVVKEIKKLDVLGFVMVVIPLISSIMIWYWFLYLDVLKQMNIYLLIVFISTILITSIVATIDSHRLGMKVQIFKNKNVYGGKFLTFFIFLLLWVYSYPSFLLRRKNFGSRNLFIPLIFSILIFWSSISYIFYASEVQKAADVYENRKIHMRRR
ncbi:MAG: hypothetical protein KAH33_01900 [Candidatus Delongbacteria bacterium]|nr:hypothetical protein [Candidatus Delongbacteria bacterium]